jgi:hypothetical protein
VKENPTTGNENCFYDKTKSSPLSTDDAQLKKAFLCFWDVQKCPYTKESKDPQPKNSKIYLRTKAKNKCYERHLNKLLLL